MWPWDHLAFGYLLHSLLVRSRLGRGPEDGPVLALVVATQFPDLVDKPLAWEFGALPHGQSLAHSLLFAVPVVLASAAAARRYGRPEHGTAVAVGYLSHLLADLAYGPLTGGSLSPAFLLWPLLHRPPEPPVGLAPRVLALLDSSLALLATPAGLVYLLLELALGLAVAALWRRDGFPGTGPIRERIGRGSGR